jgi:hypothetical protein
MANLTIVVDDELLKTARIKALQEGTSVNEICRQAIERFAVPAQQRADEMIATWREVARHVKPLPAGEKAWPGRDALYEERLSRIGRGGPAEEKP